MLDGVQNSPLTDMHVCILLSEKSHSSKNYSSLSSWIYIWWVNIIIINIIIMIIIKSGNNKGINKVQINNKYQILKT